MFYSKLAQILASVETGSRETGQEERSVFIGASRSLWKYLFIITVVSLKV